MGWRTVTVYVQRYICDSAANCMPYRYSMVDTFYMSIRRWQHPGDYHVYEKYYNSTVWTFDAQTSANTAKLTYMADR